MNNFCKTVSGMGRVPLTDEEIAQIEADEALINSIETKREATKIPVAEFCKNLWKAGLLPQAEAVEAGKGNWPPTFAATLAEMSEDEQFDAQVSWSKAEMVSRNHPIITSIAAAAGLSPELVDVLFGITWPTEP